MASASVRNFIVWLQQARTQGKPGTGADLVFRAPENVTLTEIEEE